MRAVEREDQLRERSGLVFGIVILVEGGERGGTGDVLLVVLKGLAIAL